MWPFSQQARTRDRIFYSICLLFPSLERIEQYIHIEQEPKPVSGGIPPAYWPATGNLNVENLSARYSLVRHACDGFLVPDITTRMDQKFYIISPSMSSRENALV